MKNLCQFHKNNLVSKINDSGHDGMLITNFNNIKYLANYMPQSQVFCILKENPILYVSNIEKELASKNSLIKVETFDSLSSLNDTLQKEGISSLAIEPSLSISVYEKFSKNAKGKFNLKIENFIEAERMIKAPNEIASINESTAIAQKAFSDLDLLKKYENGLSEWELAYELGYLIRKYGGDGESFDTIVATGSNSSLPHSTPRNKELASPILIDWGAKYKGYCSDNTRTIVFNEKQEEIFNIVLEAHDKSIKSIKPGIKACEIDKVARDIISEYGYGDNYIHSTGHSLGLDIHENPSISTKDQTIIENNMVFTIEPGIYLEGDFGVRIEDTVLCSKKGKILGDLPQIIS